MADLDSLEVLQTPEGISLGVPPLWLIGLWAAFATLLPICFRWLYNRLWLAGVLGAVSGALSYVSGGKLGALMVNGDGLGLVWIAAEWGLALPLLVWLAQREKRMSFKRRMRQLPRRLLRRSPSEKDAGVHMDSPLQPQSDSKRHSTRSTIGTLMMNACWDWTSWKKVL